MTENMRDENEMPRAHLRVADGKLVMDDTDAAAIIRLAAKQNCRITLNLNADSIERFKRRLIELSLSEANAVIVLANADDVNGGHLAKMLMPSQNWQELREKSGETPFARGLAERAGIQDVIEHFDMEAATKLRDMTGLAVVVVDHGVFEVFRA